MSGFSPGLGRGVEADGSEQGAEAQTPGFHSALQGQTDPLPAWPQELLVGPGLGSSPGVDLCLVRGTWDGMGGGQGVRVRSEGHREEGQRLQVRSEGHRRGRGGCGLGGALARLWGAGGCRSGPRGSTDAVPLTLDPHSPTPTPSAWLPAQTQSRCLGFPQLGTPSPPCPFPLHKYGTWGPGCSQTPAASRAALAPPVRALPRCHGYRAGPPPRPNPAWGRGGIMEASIPLAQVSDFL